MRTQENDLYDVLLRWLERDFNVPQSLKLSARIVVFIPVVAMWFVSSLALTASAVITLSLARTTPPAGAACLDALHLHQVCWRRYGSLDSCEVSEQAILGPRLLDSVCLTRWTYLAIWTSAKHILNSKLILFEFRIKHHYLPWMIVIFI